MTYFAIGLLVLLAVPTIVGMAMVAFTALWIRKLSQGTGINLNTTWLDRNYPDSDCPIRKTIIDSKVLSPSDDTWMDDFRSRMDNFSKKDLH